MRDCTQQFPSYNTISISESAARQRQRLSLQSRAPARSMEHKKFQRNEAEKRQQTENGKYVRKQTTNMNQELKVEMDKWLQSQTADTGTHTFSGRSVSLHLFSQRQRCSWAEDGNANIFVLGAQHTHTHTHNRSHFIYIVCLSHSVHTIGTIETFGTELL